MSETHVSQQPTQQPAQSSAQPPAQRSADAEGKEIAYESAPVLPMPGDPNTKQTLHVYGPLAGSIVTMPTADADTAMAAGWARDANDHYPAPEDTVHTPEETADLTEQANVAVAKLRGEPVGEPVEGADAPQPKPASQQSMSGQTSKQQPASEQAKAKKASTASSDESGAYKTRASTSET